VALYNPVSQRRRHQLVVARDILLKHRPGATPVVLGRNLGRPGESLRVTTLQRLDPEQVDMLTVVLIGASSTRVLVRPDGGQWVYTPRGYAAKKEGAA
jgi:cobalt-precorrin 5A hydrolase/precorrin-3B C17-methyltransferase